MPPSVFFGDIRDLDIDDVKPLIQQYGIKHLDTAALYGLGECETRIGKSDMSKDVLIDTKIMVGPLDSGALSPEKVDEGSKQALERLQMDKVNILHAHIADTQTPIESQARGFDDVYKKGRFTELGLSNMMPAMIEEWVRTAKEKGYVKPTWFQGHYNMVCRSAEDEIIPLLRKEGIHFSAFSPLASGFLVGNLRRDSVRGHRFVSHAQKNLCRSFFDRPAWHDAFEKLEDISKRTGLGIDELSLRWLRHHSALQDGDAIIVGGSKIQQSEKALVNLHKGPLPAAVADELSGLWSKEMQKEGAELIDPEKFDLS